MVYKDPFEINMHFQSQYTYTCTLKVRAHVQFHSVSHIRVNYMRAANLALFVTDTSVTNP